MADKVSFNSVKVQLVTLAEVFLNSVFADKVNAERKRMIDIKTVNRFGYAHQSDRAFVSAAFKRCLLYVFPDTLVVFFNIFEAFLN